MKTEKQTAAFFDLDRTLIEKNSGWLYAKFEYLEGRLTAKKLLESAIWIGLYHLNLLDLEKAYGKAVATYTGLAETILDERTQRFFHRELYDMLAPAARLEMIRHRQLDRPLVVLTNSSSYMARVSSKAWGFDGFIANHFPTDDAGRLVGRLESPICYGSGKIARAERYCAEHHIDLDQSYFYSDSYSDLPMLLRVANPRVVNPDPRLRREATRRDWPILIWPRRG